MQTSYQHVTSLGYVHTDCTAEYVLPDYQGDVKKLLITRATALPTGKFLGDTEAQLAGGICYEILYTDMDGRLTATQFSSDYELSVPLADGVQALSCVPRVTGLSVRLAGPRKLLVKCSVGGEAQALCDGQLVCEGSALEAPHTPELCLETVSMRRAVFVDGVTCGYADVVSLADGAAEHTEVLSVDGWVNVRDVHTAEGRVGFRAEAVMRALMLTEDGVPMTVCRRVGADEAVDAPSVSEDMHALVFPSGVTVDASTVADADGHGELHLTMQVTYEVRAEGNTPIRVVKDGYVCTSETENRYTELSYEEFADARTVCCSVQGELSCDEADAPVREVVYTLAEPKNVHATVGDDGDVILDGELVAQIAVLVGTEEGGRLCRARGSVPFEGRVSLPSRLPAHARMSIVCAQAEVSCVIDGERLLLEGTVSVPMSVGVLHSTRTLSSMEATDPLPSRDGGTVVTVYYPTEGETLWDVARKHRVPLKTVAQAVSLDAADGATALPTDTDFILLM